MAHVGKLGLVFLAVCASGITLASPAQNTVLPNSFDGWNGTTSQGLTPALVYAGDKATLMIVRVQSEGLQEYGLAGGEEGTYTRGTEKLHVTLYRMKDPSGAYGGYTFLRVADMSPAKLGENAVISGDRALIQTGSYVLDIRGSAVRRSEADLSALVAIVAPHADHGPLPFLRLRLPEKDRVNHSDVYILGPKVLGDYLPVFSGDWLGFSNDAEAELAKYRVKGDEFTLLIADFPTPQLASRKLTELQEKYNANAATPKEGFPPVFAKRSMTMLAITIGARSKSEGDILLDQIQSETQLTWNEPSFSVTEPSMVAMLVGTFIGTGIICLFAMISSLAFGGARLLIKRALPGKVFDRSSEMQILQLGLSSKPINAEDFYGLGGSSGE